MRLHILAQSPYIPTVQRRRILLICLAAAVPIAGLVLLSRHREPSQEGRSLTEWLQIYEAGGSDEASPTEAANAIRQIGTNALPVLLAWIAEGGESWRDKVERATRSFPAPLGRPITSVAVSDNRQAAHISLSETAFRLLGTKAYPTIPELRRLMNDTNSFISGKAMVALASMGREGVRALVEAVPSSPGPLARQTTASIASAIDRSEAHPDNRAFFQLLSDDERVRNYITNALLKLSAEALTNAAAKSPESR